MPNNEWNLQQHLVDMEKRLMASMSTISITAEEAADKAIALDGRVRNLEEKAGWIGAGFGGLVVSAVGFIWHVVSSRGTPSP
jgi:hypothetical protein